MKSWRTTLAGMISAAVTVFAGYFGTGTIDIKTAGIAAGMAALGYLAKDAGVTGPVK